MSFPYDLSRGHEDYWLSSKPLISDKKSAGPFGKPLAFKELDESNLEFL